MKPPIFVVIILAICSLFAPKTNAQTRDEINLSGPGWKLWLDKDAKWESDELFLPPVAITNLPVNPPTGGWDILGSARAVAVPGTVEEYFHAGDGPGGDIKGVSWWTRRVKIPAAKGPRRLLLRFGAVRLRAEIFVNRKLAGYDVVGNSPFEVDITDAAKPGEEVELAVRVTDPGGNFDWRDSSSFRWGQYSIPMSHGFGGIIGDVQLVSCDPVYVDDVYVQNTPAITSVNVIATVKNTTGEKISRDLVFSVNAKAQNGSPVFRAMLKGIELNPGETVVTQKISVASAKLWSVEDPNLYVCDVSIPAHDAARQTFGFRWFAPEGIGSNAVFRLNGKRIVLRTAISWGFWPINGIFPTPELAEKQIHTAKLLGQNMLTFHRCIGSPIVFDEADKQGLMYYEEPGAYKAADGAFGEAVAREKLLRMVKRDRSRASLVIFSLINERNQSQRFQPRERADMLAAHQIDPSRVITLSSSWATLVDQPQDIKAHIRPFDGEIHFNGWFDNHHAGGPEVWRQNLYRSPTNYYNRTTNRVEIVFWGEEGAISTPPRLADIKAALDASPTKGWDGGLYLDWYRRFDDFLTRKNLRGTFPNVQKLTTALGNVSLYHQGRKIETMRFSDVSDGYAVNGWEAESVENHSGIVDCWRNPKGDPAIMAYYNQPLYIAVKTRSQFAQIPGEVTVDFYAINEKNLHGAHTLKIVARDPAGHEVFSKETPVSLTGGEVFGESLVNEVKIPIAGATGMFRIEASLRNTAQKEVATGRDEVLAVDWKSDKIAGHGATWEGSPRVRDFLDKQKGVKAENYRDGLSPLDWVVVTRPPAEGEPVEVPAERFESLTATFYGDERLEEKLHQRTDRSIDYFVTDGAVPDAQVSVMENYGVRWEGKILPTTSGSYTFATESSDGVRLWVDGKLMFDDYSTRSSTINRGRITLEADKPVAVRLEFWHRKSNAQCKLLWSPAEVGAPDAQKLIERVRNDGTTLVILDRADTWMNLITNNTAATYGGSFQIGTAWLGGLHFVKQHPLFAGLPVNGAMDWPYQAVVRNGKTRSGLLLEGDEVVAGAWHCYPMNIGTAVGVIPCGKGKIIVSTLDIASQLSSADTSTEVARKLLCNFLNHK